MTVRPWRVATLPSGAVVWRSRGALDIPISTPPPQKQYHLAEFDARTFYVPTATRANLVPSIENALLIPGDPTTYVGATGSLTRYPASGEGDFTASSDGQVIQDLDIYGSVRLLAFSNVTIKNCRVRGTLATGANTATVIASNENLRGAIIEDSTLHGRSNYWLEGLRGGNYTVRRCEIYGVTDGVSLTNAIGNVQVLGCWIHDCLYGEWDATTANMPTQGSYYTHNDAVQFHRGKDYVLRGNYLGGLRAGDGTTGAVWGHHTGHLSDIQAGDDFYNSCIMLKQEVDSSDANRIERVLIEQNVFQGGVCSINHPSGNGNTFASTTIRDNQFVPFPHGNGNYYVLKSPSLATIMINNTLTTGGPVPISNGGG